MPACTLPMSATAAVCSSIPARGLRLVGDRSHDNPHGWVGGLHRDNTRTPHTRLPRALLTTTSFASLSLISGCSSAPSGVASVVGSGSGAPSTHTTAPVTTASLRDRTQAHGSSCCGTSSSWFLFQVHAGAGPGALHAVWITGGYEDRLWARIQPRKARGRHSWARVHCNGHRSTRAQHAVAVHRTM